MVEDSFVSFKFKTNYLEFGEMELLRKTVSEMVLMLLLICMLILAFNVLQVRADGSWVWVRNTVTGAYGEAVVGTGTALYIARGTSFYRYLPADNSFVELSSPPKPDGYAFKTGTALAWDFGNCIYALFGAATGDSRRWFYRYRISSNSWEALANTTFDQGEGDALTWIGETHNCLYATIGGEQRPTYLMRYTPSTNTWDDAPVNPPGGMGDGASLVWTGGDSLYALRGEFLEEQPLYDFWRYNLTADAWTDLADIPAYPHDGGVGGVGDGGSLLYIGFWLSNQTDYIYALSGNQAYPESIPDNRTYRYRISTNTWERLADLPFGVGYYVGGRLGYADGYIYAWQGTPSTWAGGGDDLAKYEFPSLSIIDKAADYLLSHFNDTVGLIYESEDPGVVNVNGMLYYHNQTYFIYNDNLLATWALKPFNSYVSNRINETIKSYNLPPSGMVEVLFGFEIPTNISVGEKLVVEQHPDRVIMAEFHNSSTSLLWEEYGDTLIYQCLNEYLRGNMTASLGYFNEAYKKWDDKGIYDLATETDHTYANYKLALILYAFKVLNLSETEYSNITKIEDKLWSMQNPTTGGITSLADLDGKPIGSANAETTAMALLPYNEELISRMRSLFGAYKKPYIYDVIVVGQPYKVIIETDGNISDFKYANYSFSITWSNFGTYEKIIVPKTLNETNLKVVYSSMVQGWDSNPQLSANETHYFIFGPDPTFGGITDVFFGEPNIEMDLSASTIALGYHVNITGFVTYREKPVNDVAVRLLWSSGWMPNEISTVVPSADGTFNVFWMPTATGTYFITGQLLIPRWPDEAPIPEAHAYLSISPPYEQQVFTVFSNSTITNLAYNSTSYTLSFAAEGPDGTVGYAKVFISKQLLTDINILKVYVDGKPIDYTYTLDENSWKITVNYTHSQHQVQMVIPEFPSAAILALFTLTTPIAAALLRKGKKKP